jgi:formylglycine-generating enzyme required for sulfatase activity
MNRERFVEIERVCQAALDLGSGERAAFLDQECRGDADLRAEVESLLAAASGPTLPTGTALPPKERATLTPGQRLGPYEITGPAGAGGMGEVYKARDTRLGRTVAIKVLPAGMEANPEHRTRFVREARAIAGVSHPHICSLYDVGREAPTGGGEPTSQPIDFLVMEYIDGTRLTPPCPLDTAIEYAIQIADALRSSHEKNILHRDLKPANVMVTPNGQVKVLDFGLAKQLDAWNDVDQRPTDTRPQVSASLSRPGVAMGTLSYMSPEQVEGKPLDGRSDIFSFGALLYELLTAKRAFQGDSAVSTLSAILRDTPEPASKVRRDVPRALEAVIDRCLQKDRDARFATAADLHRALARVQAERFGRYAGWRVLRRPIVSVPLVVLAVAAIVAGGWFAYRASRARWARNVLLPEISRLSAAGPNARAFVLAREARRYLPDDRTLQDAWVAVATLPLIQTTPPGARIEWRDYAATDDTPWESLGTTPLLPWWVRWFVLPARFVAQKLRLSSEPLIRPTDLDKSDMVPSAFVRWRVSKDGYDPLEVAFALFVGPKALELKPKDSTPPGMVRVPAAQYQPVDGPAHKLDEYYLDKYEVTNREFKAFVDAGGYRRREFWTHPFVRDGRELTWEQAMVEFRDSTGLPGPSTWAYGAYPDGQAEYPVGGVSWFEAAAYAAFKGKSLPTVHHWRNAADFNLFSDIVPPSNFGPGPAPVGKFRGMGAWGTYDMAGNVKEWCANAVHEGDRRYIVGGGFGEASTLFEAADAQPAFRRLARYGLRCALYERPLPVDLLAPVEIKRRDYSKAKPVDDATFHAIQGLYSYDHTPLNEKIESVDEGGESWRKEKISFDAAYGDHERVTAYLFLPRMTAPPYQVVVYYPSGYAIRMRSSERLLVVPFQGILRTGRAVLHPIYKGHFERKGGPPLSATANPSGIRDRIIEHYKDLARSVDYLVTRSDIDTGKLAYYGASAGVTNASVFLAMEPRLKAAVLIAGGLTSNRMLPEVDSINFAPRAKTPTLLLSGRLDFVFPVESNQDPLIRLLGAADKDKKHVVFEDTGHFPSLDDIPEAARLTLEWLDRYLGPVKTK